MWMSSSGLGHESSLSSINFQTNTSSEMSPYLGQSGSSLGMDMMRNNANSGFVQNGYSSKSSLDSVSGLKVDTPFANDWSAEEQFRLEEGLEKYKDEPSIVKYIKIANTLPDKTVREIASRCSWMTVKVPFFIRKLCKRFIYLQDKQVDLTSSIPSVSPASMASYPLLMPSMTSGEHIICEDLSGNAASLLEQNIRAFSQIKANLFSDKAHDNIDLLYQARNNLINIQNDMNNMPGLMSQMPPVSVAINDDLLLSNSSLAMPFNTMQNGGFHKKQEPLG
ncbi:unnamed protein product [Eruca vesicaria subsp. sativa]|uniref:Uncharacterized protein n=1 Tax=Eruca vesicaria subsp. sativa TaxID=29727 RepID=A0ABC8LSE7_ERUVS|nr:unnamed protein product [Eruca vesicaria subsp. sativa]